MLSIVSGKMTFMVKVSIVGEEAMTPRESSAEGREDDSRPLREWKLTPPVTPP